MLLNADPVEDGFVASLARPGGNITGVQPAYPRVEWETVGAAERDRSYDLPRRSSLEFERCRIAQSFLKSTRLPHAF